MRKPNNILIYIAKIICSVTLIASLGACADEEIVKNSNVEEGIPVEISMNYGSPKMASVSTRGLNEDQENQVNDLYILIFNSSGTTIKVGSGLYEGAAIADRKLKIKTTSGESLIYGIANVKNNQQENLLKKLATVETITNLKELFIANTVNRYIDVDRNSANLVMSGAYTESGQTTAGACTIQPNATNLSGAIKLKHLDSYINFRIHTKKVITKFEPKEWQVCNVPKQSFIVEQNKFNSGGLNSACYADSYVYKESNFHADQEFNGSEYGNDMYTFSFYQFENFKKPTNTSFTAADREKEVKEGGKNTGVFANVEPCATYVQFKAYMELTVFDEIEQKDIPRTANITIKILLGGVDETGSPYDPRNFNTWRNVKYTYDVTINNVNDIVTEVTMEGEEPRPGMEGDVIDAVDKVRTLDSHFNCFNIALTYNQVKDMSILVHTPFDEVEYVAADPEKNQRPTEARDYGWVKFKPAPGNDSGFLANYAKNNGADAQNGRLDIYSLRGDVERQYNIDKDEDKVYYYTVFIDEYYYTKKPTSTADWGNDPNLYWRHFVNEDDRYIMLVYSPKYSLDEESSYSRSRYYFKQRSIQTYYSTAADGCSTALGMEHTNESMNRPKMGWLGGNVDDDNGLYNCYTYFDYASYFRGAKWSDFIMTTSKGDGGLQANDARNTYNMESSALHTLCLTRNRDKNGNGVIDAEEMEWYVPTFRQISGMYLGATSLPSPLFTPPADGSSVIYNDPNYHFLTSEGDKIWAQEGCSNGGDVENGYEMRCVRNLGLVSDYTKPGAEHTPEKPYSATKVGNNYVFDMTKMEASNFRNSKAVTLAYHDNFKNTNNKPYMKFELASGFYMPSALGAGEYTWSFYNINSKDLCQDYYEPTAGENDPVRGKGKWRTPNQRELLIIFNTVGINEMIMQGGVAYGMYSCTYWTYGEWIKGVGNTDTEDGWRTFGINPSGKNLYLNNVSTSTKPHHRSDHPSILRCVRDIE